MRCSVVPVLSLAIRLNAKIGKGSAGPARASLTKKALSSREVARRNTG